ncbi:hypothetical protein A9Z05_31300 [Burkholderia sp. A2]|nr:hypothetical protein A9Z05_31300 [Burkholderia sp. A2]
MEATMFNAKSNVTGHLFRIHKDMTADGVMLWVGFLNINDDMIAASARLLIVNDRPDGFDIALGTTDPSQGGLGYYAHIVPTSPFPGSELRGYLKHHDRKLDDVFEVSGAYGINADGTSRLDLTIKAR